MGRRRRRVPRGSAQATPRRNIQNLHSGNWTAQFFQPIQQQYPGERDVRPRLLSAGHHRQHTDAKLRKPGSVAFLHTANGNITLPETTLFDIVTVRQIPLGLGREETSLRQFSLNN